MANAQKAMEFFSFKRLLVPLLLGLSVSAYLLYQNFQEVLYVQVEDLKGNYTWQDTNQNQIQEKTEFIFTPQKGNFIQQNVWELVQQIEWGWSAVWGFFMAFVCVVVRDFAYMLRLKILSKNFLTWKQCFNCIMLWETASAITPSVVGGSGIAMFILKKEGIPLGKSTAIVMITALLDELFFIILVPLVILILGSKVVFPDYLEFSILGNQLDIFTVFVIGYLFILILTLFISLGIFILPIKLKKFLFYVFSNRFLKKWRADVIVIGNDIIAASKEFKNQHFTFWLKTFGVTCFSWLARYLTANFVISAFVNVNDHFIILARQLVMWVIMLISPTPGGAGIAELLFVSLLKDASIHHLAIIAAIIWRLFTYYPYLLIGSIIFPKWIAKKR
jgi:uncharacterized protein (TIRG00374 family)